MNTQQIVIGHRLRAYAEVIAGALGVLRPDVRVQVGAPADICVETARSRPSLVIGEPLPEALRQCCAAWIALYPDGADRADYRIAGQPGAILHITFPQLLALVDRSCLRPFDRHDAVAHREDQGL